MSFYVLTIGGGLSFLAGAVVLFFCGAGWVLRLFFPEPTHSVRKTGLLFWKKTEGAPVPKKDVLSGWALFAGVVLFLGGIVMLAAAFH